MRAAVVKDLGCIDIVQVSKPTFGEYECLVEILTCSICSGTDRHIVDGEFPINNYPCVLGHESIGRVVKCGSKVRNFQPGDLVLRPTAVRPGEEIDGYGSLFGGFAELGVVADAEAIAADTPRGVEVKLPPFAVAQQHVPQDFEVDLAGAFITFKETLSFADQLGVSTATSVVILGSGMVGLSFAKAAKLLGAHPVIVVGRRDEPLEQALEVGADAVINTERDELRNRVMEITKSVGASYVLEAVGDWELLRQGVGLLAAGGKLGVYGVPASLRGELDRSVAPGTWSVHFVAPREDRVHHRVLDALKLGHLDLSWFVTHKVSFDEIDQGMKLVRDKKAIKVAVAISK